MILFGQPDDIDAFEAVYQDFLALVERMPHIQRRQVAHITGSPQGSPEFYRILEIYFESSDKQTEALMSPVGQEAGLELNRLPKASFQLLMADVYEEAGGSSRRAADDEALEPETDETEAAAEADGDTVAASSAD